MRRTNLEYVTYVRKIFDYYEEKEIRDITFQVTEDCNLNCSYCYQHNKTHNKMNFETAKQMIDLIFNNMYNKDFVYNIYNTQGFVINFIGGEPFLEIDLITQIIDYFEEQFLKNIDTSWFLNHVYSFATNGTLYFTPKVQSFINKYESLIDIGVTIDGNKELHDMCRKDFSGKGSYDVAIQAALDQQKKGKIGTKITLSPKNIQFLYDGLVNLISLGFPDIQINCCFEDVWNDESKSKLLLNEFLKINNWIKENKLYDKIFISMLDPEDFQPLDEDSLDKGHCGVSNGNMSAIDYKGTIYPCIRFMPSSLGNEIKPIQIGDTKKGYFYNNEQIENYQKLVNSTRKNLFNKECLNCSIAKGCSYCLGCNYELTQNFTEKKNTICLPQKVTALIAKNLAKIHGDIESYEKITLNNIDYSFLISENELKKII